MEKFAFAYDDLNRLTQMYYPQSAANDENDFDVTIGYADVIGNIGSITRRGLVDESGGQLTFGLMDDLKYTYSGGRLILVQEGASEDYGFRGVTSNFAYHYGNVISAPGISHIAYNELNLPYHIVSTNGDDLIIYYDSEGNKWYQAKQWATDVPAEYINTNGQEIKIYSRGLESINGNTKALYFDQGRAILNNGSLQRYEYYLRDHLGNNRVVFSDLDNNGEIDVTIPTTEVMETHTYYPFGMKIEGMESIEACPVYQPYGYTGKEKLLPDVYDYGARMYMASIGRWTSVDPLADAYYGISSYVYALNDPISKLDPNGMWVESPTGFYSDNPEEISALFNFLDTQEDDPPVKKDGIDWKQAGKDFVDGTPVVGNALKSGDKLVEEDYVGALAYFGLALVDLATVGFGGKIVSFASSQLAKSAVQKSLKSFSSLDDLALLFKNKSLSNASDDLLKSGWKQLDGNWGTRTVFEKQIGNQRYYAQWEINAVHSTTNKPVGYWKLTYGKINASSKNTIRVSPSPNFKP
jgi:RHS repeat-associated protein